MWRAGFGRSFGPVVRQTTKLMNEWNHSPTGLFNRSRLFSVRYGLYTNNVNSFFFKGSQILAKMCRCLLIHPMAHFH
jgi:hypothetical protein